jgi:hypothetical protein
MGLFENRLSQQFGLFEEIALKNYHFWSDKGTRDEKLQKKLLRQSKSLN